MRKITYRIVPFIMLLYFIAFIDRVNIGCFMTMNKDLGFSPAVFGFGASIFFLGYFLFGSVEPDPPVGAHLDLPGDDHLGLLSGGMAFVGDGDQLLRARFLWGSGELSSFPASSCISQLLVPGPQACRRNGASSWPRPMSTALGSAVSGASLVKPSRPSPAGSGCSSFKALPALVLGVVVLFYMTDRPEKAKWLAEQ